MFTATNATGTARTLSDFFTCSSSNTSPRRQQQRAHPQVSTCDVRSSPTGGPFVKVQYVPHNKHTAPHCKSHVFTSFREIIAVYCQSYTRHVNTVFASVTLCRATRGTWAAGQNSTLSARVHILTGPHVSRVNEACRSRCTVMNTITRFGA